MRRAVLLVVGALLGRVDGDGSSTVQLAELSGELRRLTALLVEQNERISRLETQVVVSPEGQAVAARAPSVPSTSASAPAGGMGQRNTHAPRQLSKQHRQPQLRSSPVGLSLESRGKENVAKQSILRRHLQARLRPSQRIHLSSPTTSRNVSSISSVQCKNAISLCCHVSCLAA